jgi:hypothetical protein
MRKISYNFMKKESAQIFMDICITSILQKIDSKFLLKNLSYRTMLIKDNKKCKMCKLLIFVIMYKYVYTNICNWFEIFFSFFSFRWSRACLLEMSDIFEIEIFHRSAWLRGTHSIKRSFLHFFQKKNYKRSFFSSMYTQWQCILCYGNSTAMYKFLKTLQPRRDSNPESSVM